MKIPVWFFYLVISNICYSLVLYFDINSQGVFELEEIDLFYLALIFFGISSIILSPLILLFGIVRKKIDHRNKQILIYNLVYIVYCLICSFIALVIMKSFGDVFKLMSVYGGFGIIAVNYKARYA